MKIAVKIGTSSEECRYKFEENLRPTYVKERRNPPKSGQAYEETKWLYLNALSYLEVTIKRHRTKTNIKNVMEEDSDEPDIEYVIEVVGEEEEKTYPSQQKITAARFSQVPSAKKQISRQVPSPKK